MMYFPHPCAANYWSSSLDTCICIRVDDRFNKQIDSVMRSDQALAPAPLSWIV